MSALPGDWFALLVVVYLLGMRHGMDPDHLATIDSLTRVNQVLRPRFARWSGILFSLGHGAVVIAVTVVVGGLAAEWATPDWLDSTGTWISICFLIGLGIFNVLGVFMTAPAAVVRPAGIRSRWIGAVARVNHPLLIAGIGALFALSFDTVSQVALFSLTAKAMSGLLFCVGLGVTFMLGMMTTDGINGLWISALLRRADRRARIGSRVMGLTIGVTSLLVGFYGVARETLPGVAAFADGRELSCGLLVIAVALASFLVAARLVMPEAGPRNGLSGGLHSHRDSVRCELLQPNLLRQSQGNNSEAPVVCPDSRSACARTASASV
jgi:high-affinity nickel-transport protein